MRAFALDSVYEKPDDFLRFQVRKSGLARIPFVERLAVFAFRWENPRENDVMPLSIALGTVATDSKLYLEANDEPLLALETREMYLKSPEPRQQAELTTGNYAAMSDDAKRIYENRLLGFFLLNLPTASAKPHH